MINSLEIINKLSKLDSINNMKDIKSLTYASFPGSHCPLFGSALLLKEVKDAVFVVIGTDECSYYTKQMTMRSEVYGGIDGRCVSIILNQHDITFGCQKKIESAFSELMEEYKPNAVFLITTCVVELIGDDVESLGYTLGEEYGVPVVTVHTEHFKSENHIIGLERTLSACIGIMERQAKSENISVNVIGQRSGNFIETELGKILNGSNVDINLMLPGCTVEDIRKAPQAHINIVTSSIGLPLAKKMRSKFKIPYILFEKFTDPEYILEAYNNLFDTLQLELPKEVIQLYNKANDAVNFGKEVLKGAKYIYGNTPFQCFEVNSFMTKLGMIPELIQVSYMTENDDKYIEDILSKENPYVCKSANIAPLQGVYDILKPDLYLGHEYATRLAKKGIAIVRSDMASAMVGMEVVNFFVEELVRAYKESKEYQGGTVNELM